MTITVLRRPIRDVEADIRDSRGDTEKVATAVTDRIKVHGVAVISRYSKANELETMAAMIDTLHPGVRVVVHSIWCDSKAGATYSVEIREYHDPLACAVGLLLEQVLVARGQGHNGIFVNMVNAGFRTTGIVIDPNWSGDDFG